MSSDELFSRQEALAGFPAKRASTLLFLIENRTAHLVARSRIDFSLTDPANRDLAYIEAFSLSHVPVTDLTIQDLERHAPQWSNLIPHNPSLKAALAYTLSQKYRLIADRIPNIETALGLKLESVRLAYNRQYQAPSTSIFTTKLSLLERLHWTAARIAWRIEDLPPFWLATLITVALGLPQAFLALPIAAAGMGALSSLALVIAIGIVNVLTMGNAFKPLLIQQVFGVSLMLYFGHVYVGECAKLVLPKDCSGSSLIKGSIAGTVILTILFCIWILAVNGAIAPSLLAIQTGTVLEPLAQQIGSVVTVLGSILVIFLLGMAWIRSSSLLFNITQEWIPHRRQPTLVLPCRRGRLILHSRRGLTRLGITYLGLDKNIPQFRLDLQTNDNLIRTNIAFTDSWEIGQLSTSPANIRNLNLKLNLRSATSDLVYLTVHSDLMLDYEGMLSNADINSIEFQSRNTDDKNNRQNNIPNNLKLGLLAQRRFLLAIIPLTIVFLLTEWLFFAHAQSFTSVLAFAGVLGNSLVGGIFPVLLLISSRRKGELVPEKIVQKLDRPWLLAGIYILFVAILLIHGLFIWSGAIARFSALAVAVLALGATIATIYAGAFTPRTVIELREDDSQKTLLSITAGGKPQAANISLGYSGSEQQYRDTSIEIASLAKLRYAVCQLPTKGKQELKIWAHRHNVSGHESLPTLLEVYRGNKKMQFDLKLSGGKVLLPAMTSDCWLKFTF